MDLIQGFMVAVATVGIGATIPVFRQLDRSIGKGNKGARTQASLISFSLLAGIGLALGYTIPIALSLGLAFLIWRTPGWDVIFGGTITARTKKHEQATVLRHFVFSLPILIPIFMAGAPILALLPMGAILLAFAVKAKDLAVVNAQWFDQGIDKNDYIEKTRGMFYGFAVAAVLGLALICVVTGINGQERLSPILDWAFRSRS